MKASSAPASLPKNKSNKTGMFWQKNGDKISIGLIIPFQKITNNIFENLINMVEILWNIVHLLHEPIFIQKYYIKHYFYCNGLDFPFTQASKQKNLKL